MGDKPKEKVVYVEVERKRKSPWGKGIFFGLLLFGTCVYIITPQENKQASMPKGDDELIMTPPDKLNLNEIKSRMEAECSRAIKVGEKELASLRAARKSTYKTDSEMREVAKALELAGSVCKRKGNHSADCKQRLKGAMAACQVGIGLWGGN